MPSRRRLGGHAILTCLALLIVGAALANVAGLPRVARILHPVTTVLGVDQDWRMFAPQPRQSGIRIEVIVNWSDGTRDVWVPPAGEPLLGGYRDYRWRKWMEHASLDDEARRLLPPAARYIARRLRDRPRALPAQLRVIRYVAPLSPPGEKQRTRWTPVELYRADLTAASE